MRRATLVFAIAAIGCVHGGAGATRAAAPRDLFDGALLAHVPADTPYAFAMFSPVSSRMLRRYVALTSPRVVDPTLLTKWQTVMLELGSFEPKRLDELGFAPNGRLVLYGLGAWPVVRLEIASGERMRAFVERLAKEWNVALPPPRERAGRRYWIVDDASISYLVAISRDEVIVAIAPRIVLDVRLGVLLGDELPPRAISPAAFRELAGRDGFSGRGVGFVDVARASALLRDAVPLTTPACAEAVRELSLRAPRIAFGYDDLDGGRVTWGIVVELAPELRAAARAIVAPLPGADRLVATTPLFGAAIAADVDRLRDALDGVAAIALGLGTSCDSARLASAGRDLTRVAHLSLPLAGPLSAVLAITEYAKPAKDRSREKIDGYLAVYADDVAPLVQLATQWLPTLALPPDGAVTELPDSVAPYAGHVAASRTAFAVAVGEGSERAVASAIAAPAPATRPPLATLVYDFARAATLFDVKGELAGMLGVATVDLFADERGVVLWTTMVVR